MVKCPNCGAEIVIDYENDIESAMWNFYGNSADIETILYCDKCKKTCLVIQHYDITPVGKPKIYKKG